MAASLTTHFLIIPYPQFDPVALKLGPVWIRWYGLAYVAGLLLGWYYIRRLVSNGRLWPGGAAPLSLDHVDMLLLWIMAGVVLGGRLIGIVLYDPWPYIRDPVEILRTWHGGMAFHGGLLGVVIAILLFAWRHQLRPLPIGDLVCTAAPVGLFFGRIANFVNGELWGRVSTVPWSMVFPDPEAGPQPRHPSQLYEAGLEGLVLGAVLWVLATRCGSLKREGAMTGVFMVGYALARGFCENFREGDDTWFFQSGYVTSGMLYSIPMIGVGLWLLMRARTVT
jgi:phosphatidylglycerol:prolipoprotein diacylglycerol transferase